MRSKDRQCVVERCVSETDSPHLSTRHSQEQISRFPNLSGTQKLRSNHKTLERGGARARPTILEVAQARRPGTVDMVPIPCLQGIGNGVSGIGMTTGLCDLRHHAVLLEGSGQETGVAIGLTRGTVADHGHHLAGTEVPLLIEATRRMA